MKNADKEKLSIRVRESGEALAHIAEGLRNGKTSMPDFLGTLGTHIRDLSGAGLHVQSFATGVMGLVTAFRFGFRPETAVDTYLKMLLQLAIGGAVAQQTAMMEGDSFALEHYEAIDAELGPLVLTSYRALHGETVLPPQLRQPFEQLAAWVDPEAKFQDKDITATLAPDILCDIAARLSAMGHIE